jgi:cytidylate kinase
MGAGLVVCFSGRIGSGKSSVTQTLANALRWPRASFGDYVRARVADRGGDPSSRKELQNLGQMLVETDPSGFAAAVLQARGYKRGADLLVDGIRHVAIQETIARLVSPSPAFLIHLAADDFHVRHRIEHRTAGLADLPRAEGHAVEAEVRSSLPSIASVVIDANVPLHVVLDRCLTAIERFGAPPQAIANARAFISSVEE